MDGTRQADLVRDVIKCPVCFEGMDAPKMAVGCGHTYCTPCIEQLDRRPCPVCRLVITDTKPNFSLAELPARFAEVLARYDD
ncbi:unnamed protein product [Caenorhabditis brenneri]